MMLITRQLVPLKPGENSDDYERFTPSGLEIPEGMREETDEEFRERILFPKEPIGVCKRCGKTVWLVYGDCFEGDEIEGGGTEAHIFE